MIIAIMNYFTIRSNSNNKNNLKLSINKEGVYNLKVGAGNSNKNEWSFKSFLGVTINLFKEKLV